MTFSYFYLQSSSDPDWTLHNGSTCIRIFNTIQFLNYRMHHYKFGSDNQDKLKLIWAFVWHSKLLMHVLCLLLLMESVLCPYWEIVELMIHAYIQSLVINLNQGYQFDPKIIYLQMLVGIWLIRRQKIKYILRNIL